ncbi:hypothetical protein ACQKEX_14990 [Bacillus pumilus]|uniref:hypothetical protein n=1 Tax=Bacillus TaxID=1386 RepID=UPI000966BB76|nr:hypothetical protein [Bacillus pumilus]MBU8576361.1 hypothetical protein [Bacillus pumilus]OLP64441.1 hypothetical protein BACPU_26660 [Bacillus pumilus]
MSLLIDKETDMKFFDSVRRLLGGIEEEELTNESIEDPVFMDTSEMELINDVPCLLSEDVTVADKEKGRLALIYLVASKLCQTVKSKTEHEVKTIDVSWKKSPVKWDVLQETLVNTALTLINGITCYEAKEQANILSIAPSKRAVSAREKL